MLHPNNLDNSINDIIILIKNTSSVEEGGGGGGSFIFNIVHISDVVELLKINAILAHFQFIKERIVFICI